VTPEPTWNPVNPEPKSNPKTGDEAFEREDQSDPLLAWVIMGFVALALGIVIFGRKERK
jgi:hypothetical protein